VLKSAWVLLLSFTAALFAAHPIIPIPVSVSGSGFVSLAICDSNGVIVRTIAYAEPINGSRTLFWDGTSDMGLPVAPARYSTRGVFFTNAPSANFVMKVGTSGNPPWRTKDGTGDWGGDLGGPSAIVANSSSLMVVWSAVENKTLPGVQQIDTNGNVLRSYTTFYPWDGRMAAAMDATNFFLGILNRDAERIEIARYELGTTNKSILTILPTPPHYTLSGRWKGRWQAMLDGLAMNTTNLFASIAADDRLFIFDRTSGATLQQVSLPSPRGIALSGNRLLVVSSNRVFRLTLGGVVETNLIASTLLLDPYALAVDRGGNIYVADSGARQFDSEAESGSHQIHVFTTNGAFVRSIGAPGGSPRSGALERLGFGDIQSICIGPDNKLWVQEEITGFKRTSRWTTNGALEREWFQRKLTHYADLVNPAHPDELIYATSAYDDYAALTAFRVNWTNGTWEPTWSWTQKQDDMFQEDVFLSNTHPNPLQELLPGTRHPVFDYAPGELVTFNGRNYFMNHDGNGDGAIFTYSATNKPQPVALLGFHRINVITNKVVSGYDSGPNQWFTWADADGDDRMEMSEFTFTIGLTKLDVSTRIWDAKLESNLSIRVLRAIGTNVLLESVLPVKFVLPNGAPVYDWSMLQDLTRRQMPSFTGGDGWKTVYRVGDETMPLGVDGAAYALIDPLTEETLTLPSLDGFWADRNWRKKIAKFDRVTGKFLWAVGRRAPDRAVNGEMYNPFGISVSHGTIFAADVLGMVWTWTTDGLYLGRLLHDAEPGRAWDEYAIHAEVQSAVTLVTNTATGKLYMILNDTGAHVYEVTLPNVQPLAPLPLDVTPEILANARPWDPDGPVPVPGSFLTVTNGGATVKVSWHTNAGSFVLQSGLNATGTWNTLLVPRQTNGETISVLLPKSSPQRFYRLLK
jgi:hypothetical protein